MRHATLRNSSIILNSIIYLFINSVYLTSTKSHNSKLHQELLLQQFLYSLFSNYLNSQNGILFINNIDIYNSYKLHKHYINNQFVNEKNMI